MPRRGLRRPAAAGEGDSEESVATKFAAGEFVEANKVPVTALVQGLSLVVKAEYWQAACQLCGTIHSLQVRGAEGVEGERH